MGQKSKVRIDTYSGPLFLNKGEPVWVSTGHGRGAAKLAEHVTEDDRIALKDTPQVTASLEQIHRALYADDSSYKYHHDQLMYYDERTGRHLPKLQKFLLKTFGLTPGDLDDAKTTGRPAAEIQEKLVDAQSKLNGRMGRATRKTETVANWLRGNTILPNTYSALLALRHLNRSEFDETFSVRNAERGSFRKPREIFEAHKEWSLDHRMLRTILGEKTGKPIGDKDQITLSSRLIKTAPSGTKRDWNYKVDLVLKSLKPIFEPVDEETAFVRVKKVSRSKGSGLGGRTGTAVKKDDKRLGFEPEQDFSRVYRERWILGKIISEALQEIEIPLKEKQSMDKLEKANAVINLLSNLDEIKQSRDELVEIETGAVRPIVHASRKDALKAARNALEKLNDGSLDEKHGLQKGTLLKINDEQLRLASILPVIDDQIDFYKAYKKVMNAENAEAEREASYRTDYIKKALGLEVKEPAAKPVRRELSRPERRELARVMDSKLRIFRQYGIPPVGLLTPATGGESFDTEAGFQRELAEFNKRHEARGGKETFEFPLPPNLSQLKEALVNAGVEPNNALLNLYGRENLLLRERHARI